MKQVSFQDVQFFCICNTISSSSYLVAPFAWAHSLSLKFTGQRQLFIGPLLDLPSESGNDCSHISAILDLSCCLLLFSCNVFWGLPALTSFPTTELWVAFFFFLTARQKSHLKHDDHFTETKLCCHLVHFISTYFDSANWWCLLESKLFLLHLCQSRKWFPQKQASYSVPPFFFFFFLQ